MGFIAKLIRSDLKISKEIITFLSVYLMIGIGLQGGAELQHLELAASLQAVFVGIAFGVLQPIIAYYVLNRGGVDTCNSAALAAPYGSVRVGPFFSAAAFLRMVSVAF